ncbi:MAG: phytanoyl-CoA dioxygenase family protein [Casimicrobiaceae bacterium]
MISRQQIEQYREQGSIIVPGVLDEFTRKRMQSVLADLVEKSRKVSAHDDVYDLEPGHTSDEPRVRRIKTPHIVDPVFAEFMRSPPLLSILQALLGENVRLHGSKLNLKAPQFGSPVDWHQDWAFYPHTNDDLLAVGVMLDDTTVENGAMYVMPGTHQGPTFDHHGADGFFCGAIDAQTSGLDFSKAVPCEGVAGSCSFHHVRLVHGSAQNTSNRSRGLLLYEAGAADAFPLVGIANYDEFRSRLLCGQETIVPRFRHAPARMPLPPAKNQGSIYENQTARSKRYFGAVEVSDEKRASI